MGHRGCDVVVVGAGIVGSSVAYHAARLGAAVTVVERALPGAGVTGASFAWIGASGVAPGPAAALRRAACAEYRRLEATLPEVRVRWTGSVSWPHAPGTSDAQPAGDQSLLGAAEIAAVEPNLREPPVQALHTRGDGAVDPVAVTEALVQGAEDHGASVLVGATAVSLRARSGRLAGVETTSGFLPAPTVVLAAGTDVPGLCAPLGIAVPVAPSPAVLVRFSGARGMVKTLVASPDLEIRESAGGGLVAAVGYRGESSRRELVRTAQRTLARLGSMFHGAEPAHVTGAHIGWRPVPRDGEPIIGPVAGVEGLYLAVMHSGVTLAPVAGRLAAEEIVDRRDAPELGGCRLARFARAAHRRA